MLENYQLGSAYREGVAKNLVQISKTKLAIARVAASIPALLIGVLFAVLTTLIWANKPFGSTTEVVMYVALGSIIAYYLIYKFLDLFLPSYYTRAEFVTAMKMSELPFDDFTEDEIELTKAVVEPLIRYHPCHSIR